MSTDSTLLIESDSLEQTEQIAEQVGRNLKGGEVLELVSDLGGGKTSFVRGLSRGAGSKDHVSSPSFKLSNIYKSKNITINHFDLYRLSEPGLIENEIEDILGYDDQVLVVEWGKMVKSVLPKDRLTIEFKNLGKTKRQLTFSFPKKLEYLVEAIK